jgi:hypothetical protein
VRQAEPCHPDQPGHVDVEHVRLVFVGRLVERRASEREAGVVDEDVEASEAVDGFRDELLAVRGVGHVELERHLRLEPLDAPSAAHDAHSRGGERRRRRAADARRRPGDDRPLAGQVESGQGGSDYV